MQAVYLGAALADSATLTDAVRLTTDAGALAVTKPDASPSLPLRIDVDTFLTARGADPTSA